MAKGITRTLVTTEISVAKFENGELLPLQPIVEDGKVEKEQAVKIANRKYKEEGQVVVTDVVTSEPVKYRISIEDFVKYAEVVETDSEDESEGQIDLEDVEEQEASGF